MRCGILIVLLYLSACASGKHAEPNIIGGIIIIDDDVGPPLPIEIAFREVYLDRESDSLRISGQVFGVWEDLEREPLPGANVTFRDPLEGMRGVATDSLGYFTLVGSASHPKNDTLIVSFIGYQTRKYATEDLLKKQ